MTIFFASSLQAYGYLVLLIGGYASIGWLLAAFQVPGVIWLGTFAVTLHLIHAEADAIALASAWVVGVVSIGAIDKAWIPIWNVNLPHEDARLWAIGLLGFWLWAMLMMSSLAFARSGIQAIEVFSRRITRKLILLVWLAIGSGWLTYHLVA